MSMSYSFTKKGPGRKHDYSGVYRKIHSGMTFRQQYLIREKCGAVTETFWRRYRRYLDLIVKYLFERI